MIKILEIITKNVLSICLPYLVLMFVSPVYAMVDASDLVLDAKPLHIAAPKQINQGTIELSITSNGKALTLELQKNDKLISRLGKRLHAKGAQLYSGKIKGNDNSWVRINKVKGKFTGAFYDGEELFLIESSDAVSAALPPLSQQRMQQAQSTDRVVFRASDALTNAMCGMQGGQTSSAYESLVNELAAATSAATADQQLNLVIVADTEYVASSGGDVDSQVLSQMNIVDGIFSEQVGVQFGITNIIGLSSNGSLTSTNPETLLSNFRSFVNSQVGNPGLAHLFSGKNLQGNIIGIAYLNALCSSIGVGVTQAGGRGVLGALTVAHELGHNFGAPHDNQVGSACSGTPGGFLMNPVLNGSDQFSQCSLNQMADDIASASCLVEPGPPEPPQITSTPNTTASVGIPYAYDSDSTLEASGSSPITYVLNTGPAGMNVSSAGVVTWTPSSTGAKTVQITANNVGGIDSQTFNVNVAPAPLYPPLNFAEPDFVSYGGEDTEGELSVEDAGGTLRLTGNRWVALPIDYTITSDTVIEFDFSSGMQGEIHGFGFDNNLDLSVNRLFALYGTQSLPSSVITTYRTYPGGNIVQHYTIPVGQYYTGAMQYLFFAMDHDLGASGESVFSNIRIYEQGAAPPTPTAPQITSVPNNNATVGTPYAYDTDSTVNATGTGPLNYALNVAPAGMTINVSGVINWTPQPSQLGVHAVALEVSNSAGAVVQNFNINVVAAPPIPILNFNNATLSSYGGEDRDGTATVEDAGATLRLVGNRWLALLMDYTVTPDTILEFDFRSGAQGEIHGIGLDNDLELSLDRLFALYGTQSLPSSVNTTYRNYPGGNIVQRYTIPVGQHFTGPIQYLFFAMDHDAGLTGESVFSNVRVYELGDIPPEPTIPQITSVPNINASVGTPYAYDADSKVDATGSGPLSYALNVAPAGMTISTNGVISWTPQVGQEGVQAVEVRVSNSEGVALQSFNITVAALPVIPPLNFNDAPLESYGGEDKSGTKSIEDGGETLRLVGNRWSAFPLDYTITSDTVIEFDFRSSAQGEIHGFGFDNNLDLSINRLFALYGTQSLPSSVITTYRTYPGGDVVQHYVIPVGQYYTGAMQYLFFAMDHDIGASGESVFSNVRIYEEGAIPPTPIAPQITSTPNTNATVGTPYTYDADSTVDATGTAPLNYALNIAPTGMTINANGVISWTPQAGQVGTRAVEIQVSNIAGVVVQNFNINVVEAPVIPPLNFNDATLMAYGGEDKSGTLSIEDGGETLRLVGNRWVAFPQNYTITPNTVIEFDFRSSVQGEIHGFGFDTDLDLSVNRLFSLYGFQSLPFSVIQTYQTYPGGDIVQHYVIPVGQHYTGPIQYLFFAMDHDIGASGESVFSNVRVYEP